MKIKEGFILLEVVHKDSNNGKVGITIDLNNYKFLKELYNQYGDFTISKSDKNEIILNTE